MPSSSATTGTSGPCIAARASRNCVRNLGAEGSAQPAADRPAERAPLAPTPVSTSAGVSGGGGAQRAWQGLRALAVNERTNYPLVANPSRVLADPEGPRVA
eukprot:13452289-Alexandrium_andersonii.AAC.1